MSCSPLQSCTGAEHRSCGKRTAQCHRPSRSAGCRPAAAHCQVRACPAPAQPPAGPCRQAAEVPAQAPRCWRELRLCARAWPARGSPPAPRLHRLSISQLRFQRMAVLLRAICLPVQLRPGLAVAPGCGEVCTGAMSPAAAALARAHLARPGCLPTTACIDIQLRALCFQGSRFSGMPLFACASTSGVAPEWPSSPGCGVVGTQTPHCWQHMQKRMHAQHT